MTNEEVIKKEYNNWLIFLSGAQSVGKTSLANQLLAEIENSEVITEVARSIVAKNGWTKKDFDPTKNPERFFELQKLILKEQSEIFARKLDSSKTFIVDRAGDALAYAKLYIGNEAYEKLLAEDYVQAVIEKVRSGIVFTITPNVECIEVDEVRICLDQEMEKANILSDFIAFHTCLTEIYDDLGISYHVISMLKMEKRVSFVKDKLANNQL